MFKVIAVTETGEEICLKARIPTAQKAEDWCDENEANYPESILYIEREENRANELFSNW